VYKNPYSNKTITDKKSSNTAEEYHQTPCTTYEMKNLFCHDIE